MRRADRAGTDRSPPQARSIRIGRRVAAPIHPAGLRVRIKTTPRRRLMARSGSGPKSRHPRTISTARPRVGLLAFGSSYSPPLPGGTSSSGLSRLSSPITAAGPRWIRTTFPFDRLPTQETGVEKYSVVNYAGRATLTDDRARLLFLQGVCQLGSDRLVKRTTGRAVSPRRDPLSRSATGYPEDRRGRSPDQPRGLRDSPALPVSGRGDANVIPRPAIDYYRTCRARASLDVLSSGRVLITCCLEAI